MSITAVKMPSSILGFEPRAEAYAITSHPHQVPDSGISLGAAVKGPGTVTSWELKKTNVSNYLHTV